MPRSEDAEYEFAVGLAITSILFVVLVAKLIIDLPQYWWHFVLNQGPIYYGDRGIYAFLMICLLIILGFCHVLFSISYFLGKKFLAGRRTGHTENES